MPTATETHAPRFGSYVAYSLLALFAGLPLGCLAGGLLLTTWQLVIQGDTRSATQGLVIGMFAVPIGLLPAVLFGAPAYALLASRGRANWETVAVAGSLPGLLLLPWEDELGWFAVFFGVCVALCTHLIAARRMQRLRAGAPIAVPIPVQ